MESIFFIIVLEIVFFSIYRWGTEAERVNDFVNDSFNKNPEAEERPAPCLAVCQAAATTA